MLERVRDRIESIAVDGETPELKRLGYAAWVAAAGPDDAYLAASKDKESLRDFLDSVPTVAESVRGELFEKIRPLIAELPSNLKAESTSGLRDPGIRVEFYQPNPSNVAVETLDKLEPKETGIVPEIKLDVPQKKVDDAFALRFTGNLSVPQSGEYRFYITSDDGSRLYLDGRTADRQRWRPRHSSKGRQHRFAVRIASVGRHLLRRWRR